MNPSKDPNFDDWVETWDGTWTIFQFYWKRPESHSGFPDYVRENMTIAEITKEVEDKK